MGLDITAYQGLKVTGATQEDDSEVVQFWANTDFPGREEGLSVDAYYAYEDSFKFRAGGYGGYNAWRNTLAKVAGYPESEVTSYGLPMKTYCAACWSGAQGPFAELINFSDCEGVIGPVVAKKLAADFAEFEEKARNEFDERGFVRYHDFKTAFEMAADNGAVAFH